MLHLCTWLLTFSPTGVWYVEWTERHQQSGHITALKHGQHRFPSVTLSISRSRLICKNDMQSRTALMFCFLFPRNYPFNGLMVQQESFMLIYVLEKLCRPITQNRILARPCPCHYSINTIKLFKHCLVLN